MKREIYDEDHEAFRDSVKQFLDREVVPHLDTYAAHHGLDRDFWLAAGKQVKDALASKAIQINDMEVGFEQNMALDQLFARDRSRFGRFFLARLGKKKYHLFELVD